MSKFALLLAILSSSTALARAEAKFEVRNGDRIALVGDTLIERAQESGWLETEMAADFPERRFVVRDLGWSADTPAGKSRASFDFADPQKAFSLLTTQIAQVKPTVVVLGYGMASSFDGEPGLAQFKAEMNRLIDTVQANATNRVRFVIFGPLRHQKLAPPLPDPEKHNGELMMYNEALRDIAVRRGFPFVDLFDWDPSLPVRELTDDGIHLTPAGYRGMAGEVARQSGWPRRLLTAQPATIEQLRQIVVRKDQLFFDRWRPQNETYLFGFRKHEQGQNAREIPEFDPLVAAQDDQIAQVQQLIENNVKTNFPAKEKSPARAFKSLPLPDFTVAPGFEVNLWAEDPLLAKPIQMNFDPQGRLWVATSEVYPQILPGQTANDKIIVLEDPKGVGHATKSTVFVDGLFIPQGVEPGDGGCYVGQSTELLHFDGVVGQRRPPAKRVVLSGFGTEDTHHMVHTLAWGPDGMLYFNQSIYIHSHIETPNGVVRLNSGGVFHLRPESMQLDVFLRGFCNPWGHQFDSFGQSFITDGAGWQGISWGIRDATYFTYAEARRELQAISPGNYPKFCGLEIVGSQQFPNDWQGDFITSDFRAHRVVRFSVSDDGSGYVTKEMPDVLTSANVTFRPVDAKFGPDGALYIADWANPIINHGEVDFRDPRRDHEHGRIWRITAKGRPLAPRRNFATARDGQLLDELLSPNIYNVQQARRVLTERGHRIGGALRRWTARHENDPKAQLDALWMYQSIGVRNDPLLDRVLQAPDGRIRAAAVRVLSAWPRIVQTESGPAPGECYERALADPFPRVRVEALRAAALIPSLRSAGLALDTLNRPMDPFLDYTLWLTINDLAKPWLAGLQSGAWKIDGHEKEIEFALNALPADKVGIALDEALKRKPLARDGAGPWIELIGRSGSADDATLLYHHLLNNGFDNAAAVRAEKALNAGASRGVKPKSDLDKIAALFDSGNENTRLGAVELAGDWGGPGESFARLLSLAREAGTPQPLREASIAALRKIGGTKSIEALQPLAAPGESIGVRQPAVLALAALDPAHCGSNAVALLSGLASEETALPVWRSLLSDAGSGPSLAGALPRSGFPAAAGKAGLRAVRESGQNDPELIVAIARAAGLQGKETALTAAEEKKLGETALKEGDPARGERIFRSQQQSCLTCHSIGGVGAKVGPDLTSIGTSSPIDYLIDSVFYPNKEIKDGYQAVVLETKDGEDMSGIPVREDAKELVIRTASDQLATIAKDQIKTRKMGGSLMPSGLADSLTQHQQLDLFRFLSELGKPGPFDASKGDVARLWWVAPDTAGPDAEGKLIDSKLTGGAWHRAPSLVSGRALAADLENDALGLKHAKKASLLAGTRFRSVKAGLVHFDLSAPAGAAVWVDGKTVQHANPVTVDVPAGTHVILIRLDGRNLPSYIRLQSDDGTFLTE